MGWCTTFDLDRFATAAGGYLRSTAAENTLLLSAVQAARSAWDPRIAGRPPGAFRPHAAGSSPAPGPAPGYGNGPGTAMGAAAGPAPGPASGSGNGYGTGPGTTRTGAGPAAPGLLLGWWEPPDGGEPRGAFLHDPPRPLLIAGRAPEMAAALAGTLAKMGRDVSGVDGPIEAADAFAAAWSHRAGATVRMHKQSRVYRLVARGANGTRAAAGTGGAAGSQAEFPDEPAFLTDPARPGPAARVPLPSPSPVGRLRVATHDDRALIADWLTGYATEMGERLGSAQEMADDLISYGGAVIWESPQRMSRIREAAQHLVGSHHRDAAYRDAAYRDAAYRDTAAQNGDPAYQPVAMAALTRPVAGTVRISVVYTLPDRRRNGYAAAVMFAASRAAIEGIAPRPAPDADPQAGSQVVMITDTNRPDRRVARLGYQLVGERAVLRFGPATGPLPSLRTTGPMPRLPTGPLPRFKR